MKKITFLSSLLVLVLLTQAQVAINTTGTAPEASAMLDVSATNKGILVPRVSLTSIVDNVTIPNPATSLLVYNTNAALIKGAGYYYNNGTPASPKWQAMQDLMLPFAKATTSNVPAFRIENYTGFSETAAIKGDAGESGRGVEGTSVNGVGVYAKSLSGNALAVEGKMKITGNGQAPAQGKVLTSDAAGNATWEGAVAFSAGVVVSPGSNVIPSGVYTKVKFAGLYYNLSGAYSGPNAANHSVFTVPVNGIYHFDAVINWDPNDVNNYRGWTFLSMIRNGAKMGLFNANDWFKDNESLTQHIHTDVQLQAGDQIFVEVFQVTYQDMLLRTNGYTDSYFNGRLVMKL